MGCRASEEAFTFAGGKPCRAGASIVDKDVEMIRTPDGRRRRTSASEEKSAGKGDRRTVAGGWDLVE